MTATISIRDATTADAGALGRITADAWQQAYRGLIPATFLATVTPEARTAAWQRVLAAPRDPGTRILVATVPPSTSPLTPRTPEADAALPRVVGYVTTGRCRDDGSPDGLGELRALYVAPGQWRGGVGTALLDAGRRALVEAGFTAAVLWVLAGNRRARSFYEARGWSADGASRQIHREGTALAEVRYTLGPGT